jgi:crotonobetainyl-CoA:carnitine CoA-transferase CaiB-like acyl-CoA transferase
LRISPAPTQSVEGRANFSRETEVLVSGVLSGIRVLDFGRFIAAPLSGAILADMGAEVIRVEKRDGGEDRWVQPVAEGGEGATFLQCNRNKQCLTLDTTTEQGQEVLARLVRTADIVIANMPDAAMAANGLDYESLKAIKPDIILARATAFGSGGPYADKVGFDGIGQVMSGGVYRSGPPEQPYRSAVPYVDFGTGLSLTIGVMMALFHRNQTGEGQEVEASLLPVALTMANGMLIEQELLKLNRGRVGNRGQAVAPCDIFKLGDKWILVQTSGNPMFRRFCRMIGRPEWIDDPRFANDDLRSRESDVLNGAMQEWCDGLSYDEAMIELDAARIPAGPVYSPQEAVDDENVKALRQLVPMDYPGIARPAPISATPFRLSATPGEILSRAPLLGEHNASLLAELDYSPEEIAELAANGIV